MRRVLFWGGSAVVALLLLAAVTAVPDAALKTLVLGVGGPGLLVGAPLYLIARIRFRGRAVRVTGIVEHCEEGPPDEAACTLTVRFTTLEGRPEVFTEDRAPRRAVGQEVPVLYDPRTPSGAQLYRRPVADAFTTVVMLAIGAVLTYAFWRGDLGG